MFIHASTVTPFVESEAREFSGWLPEGPSQQVVEGSFAAQGHFKAWAMGFSCSWWQRNEDRMEESLGDMGCQPRREAWGRLVPGSESTGLIKWSFSWAPDVWTAQSPHSTLDHQYSEQTCSSLRLGLSSGCHLWAWASATLHWLGSICLYVWANDCQSWLFQTAIRWRKLRHRETCRTSVKLALSSIFVAASDPGGWDNVMACSSTWAPILFRNPARTIPLYHSCLHAILEADIENNL